VTRRVVYLCLLGLIFLVGCNQKSTKTATQIPAPPPSVPQQVPRKPIPNAMLTSSAGFMRGLVTSPATALPDALLNRTRCFVLFEDSSQGLANCREEGSVARWSAPTLVSATMPQRPSGNLLLFVLSERAAQSLQRGRLSFSGLSLGAGKTHAQAALLTPSELGFDVVGYISPNQQLAGTVPDFVRALQTRDPRLVPASYSEAADSVTSDRAGATEYLHWVTSFFNTINPTGIIIHHSALIPVSQTLPKNLQDVDNYHAQRGFDIECFGREYHVAYHYLILSDGHTQNGRPERCQGAHARGYNSYIGISMVGDFSSKEGSQTPTSEQLKSLVRLTRQLQRRYNIPVQRILRHGDVAPTDCPGDRFAFKQFLLTLMKSSTGRP
jgi:N-acetylmuramoyl-L-alanine amidase